MSQVGLFDDEAGIRITAEQGGAGLAITGTSGAATASGGLMLTLRSAAVVAAARRRA